MQVRNLLAVGAGLVGAASIRLLNRSVTLDAGELEAQLPAPPSMWDWEHGQIAIYERGRRASPPVLLLHGHNAAASAMEMREPFSRLARTHHVFAPDLLGYGLSDRPNISYTPDLYIQLITDMLRDVVGQPAIVLASSLSAAYAIEVAAHNPDIVQRLVLVCPTGVRSKVERSLGGGVMQAILRSPILGKSVFNALSSRSNIRQHLVKQIYHDKSLVTSTLVEDYYRTAHIPGARYAPAAFVGGGLYHDASGAWERSQFPALIIWGREAKLTPPSNAAPFLATNPRAELQEVPSAGLLPHDEQPEQFTNLVLEWLGRIE